MAGGGAYAGGMTGALSNYFAPIMPYRLTDLAAGIYFRQASGAIDASDAISLFYIPGTSAQTTLSEAMPQPSSELKVNAQANCPPAKLEQLCGFSIGMQAMIFDDTGSWDYMTITQVQPASLHLQHKDPLSKSYQPGAVIAMAATYTYYLLLDDATKTYQLRLFNGISDLPLVDNVIKLEFEFYGEPKAPTLLPNKSLTDPVGPYTTYGPKPPPLGVDNDKALPVRAYHKLLDWDIMMKPLATRVAEQALSGLLARSGEPVLAGFIDADATKAGSSINGVPVQLYCLEYESAQHNNDDNLGGGGNGRAQDRAHPRHQTHHRDQHRPADRQATGRVSRAAGFRSAERRSTIASGPCRKSADEKRSATT